MGNQLFLFTLHESEEDFRVKGAVLARSSREAASILGGEFVEVENQPPGSSTNPDDLNLFGKIKFAHELFRRLSDNDISHIGYDPGRCYEKYPGFVIWAKSGQDGREFILRRNYICLPDYVSD